MTYALSCFVSACGEGRGESDDLDGCKLRFACELRCLRVDFSSCPTECMENILQINMIVFGIHFIFRFFLKIITWTWVDMQIQKTHHLIFRVLPVMN